MALALASILVFAVNGLAAAGSTATITGSFADACRDFTAHSSKDISHAELHYVDGRVVKDETINRHDHSIDGGPGAEIDFAIVKSGTTKQTFTCQPPIAPPTAILEIQSPPLAACQYFPFPDYVTCLGTDPRTVWSRPTDGLIVFLFEQPFPPLTFDFRGTSSTDPDNDIVSWSIDFGDGTSTSGSWTTEPPTR